MLDKNFLGLDGFVWFFGVVEDRQDPLGLGRVKVRCYGWHSESLVDIPTENLPWATMSHSTNNRSFSTPREADLVFGFFADGRSGQIPIIIGIVPGYFTNPPNTGAGFNDLRSQATLKISPKKPVSREYKTDGSGIVIKEANTANSSVVESLRHPNSDEQGNSAISAVTRYGNLDNTVIAARKKNLDKDIQTAGGLQWSEPYPAYNALYPYNNATETESGHVFELDDTPKSERINITHRSGSYTEWFPSGSKVEKVTKSNYSIVMADDHVHVMGKVLITVDSDAYIKVLGDVKLEVGNDLEANVSGSMNLSIKEDLNIKAASLNIDISGDASLITGGDQFLTSGGDINSVASGSNYMTAGSDAHVKAGSGAYLNGGSSTDVKSGGSVNVEGSSTNVDKYKRDALSSASASSASGGASGAATGISEPAERASKNDAEVTAEAVPVPLQSSLIDFDPEIGEEIKHQKFLVEGANGELVEPTAQVDLSNVRCLFDANTRAFISDKVTWSLGIRGKEFIKSAEGFSATAYYDPPNNPVTISIGYGTTGASIDRSVKIGDTVTREQAEIDLVYAVNKKFLPALKQNINVAMTQEMIDACLSLMYNIGAGNFAKSSVKRYINERNWCAAAEAFLLWNRASGRVLNGLSFRRNNEKQLFLT